MAIYEATQGLIMVDAFRGRKDRHLTVDLSMAWPKVQRIEGAIARLIF